MNASIDDSDDMRCGGVIVVVVAVVVVVVVVVVIEIREKVEGNRLFIS
jgi:hypothetical protein